MNEAYFQRLQGTLEGIVAHLREKGVKADRLTFGGAGAQPQRRPTVPTDARSEFLANRAMGDWAERMLAGALRAAFPEWTVTQYGNADRIAAGDPGFRGALPGRARGDAAKGKAPGPAAISGAARCRARPFRAAASGDRGQVDKCRKYLINSCAAPAWGETVKLSQTL